VRASAVMKPVTVTTTIDRPREEVFDFLAPLANHEAFTDHVLKDWRVSEDGRTVRVTVHAPGQKVEAEIVALEEERPSRTLERTTSAGGRRRTLGTYRLTDAPGGGTHVAFEITWEAAPLADRLTAPIGRAFLKKVNTTSMERLKELLEQR
jgi:uncharacterized membrane protein